jgi:hypothetical protein
MPKVTQAQAIDKVYKKLMAMSPAEYRRELKQHKMGWVGRSLLRAWQDAPAPLDIDKPIISIIVHMNTLGYRTVESCCGYDYPGQTDRDHSDTAYVVFESSFSQVRKLKRACDGFWAFLYLGDSRWVVRSMCGPAFLIRFAWPTLKRALEIL